MRDESKNKAHVSGIDSDNRVKSAGEKAPPTTLSFWQVMMSVICASFGIQNKANKERDFSQGKLLPFIFGALVFTAMFIAIIVTLVKLALSGDA